MVEMIEVFVATGILISFSILLCLYRAAFGPGAYNRLAAVSVIGTKTVVLVAIVSYAFERPSMFLDISLLYAIINFIGILIITKYLERNEVCS